MYVTLTSTMLFYARKVRFLVSAMLFWPLLLLAASRCSGLVVPPASRRDGLGVSYFAFGSNMASSVLEGRRGLRPLAPRQRALARGFKLAFTLPGFAPLEPAFASLEEAAGEECHGVLYTLSPLDWLRLCASEGVPFGYRVVTVQLQLYDGRKQEAYSLQAVRKLAEGDSRRPSAR